jgi:Icc-related predicted phosphoesterase
VLVTHRPPHGVLDLVPRDLAGAYENTGCKELLRAVKRIKPKLHVFGHIHEGYGVNRGDEITFLNACICDAAYRPINPPLSIIDIL